ncbi:MAG: aldehyde dehydrogenase family protein [Pseudomonadota bacterium]
MEHANHFYIDGKWVKPHSDQLLEVINPANETSIGQISLGNEQDVNDAVAAAKRAFESFSLTSKEERIALLQAIIEAYQKRSDDIASWVSAEMGAPLKLAQTAQVGSGLGHFVTMLEVLKNFEFEEHKDGHTILREPAGVCGLITPWNWPLNQICCKVAPAIAAGCTMVLKPTEIAPMNALVFAEVMDEAGVPAGVFNLVNGDGPTVGRTLSTHPDIDMMSFTGSTRAGTDVSEKAAATVKRVSLELGGKSANIILDDADFEKSIQRDMFGMCVNSGQSCNAPTRMLVPHDRMSEAAEYAKQAAEKITVGDPTMDDTTIGPVVSETQFNKIQGLIEKGIEEGAKLETGGPGRPDGMNAGYYVKPTVFSNVTNDMTIAREEIFGPVLSIIGYENDDDAVRIANETVYGLSGYISSGDAERARDVAKRLRTGNVHLNGAPLDQTAPFGGYRQSGNGREWGAFGLEEFLETKAVMG